MSFPFTMDTRKPNPGDTINSKAGLPTSIATRTHLLEDWSVYTILLSVFTFEERERAENTNEREKGKRTNTMSERLRRDERSCREGEVMRSSTQPGNNSQTTT